MEVLRPLTVVEGPSLHHAFRAVQEVPIRGQGRVEVAPLVRGHPPRLAKARQGSGPAVQEPHAVVDRAVGLAATVAREAGAKWAARAERCAIAVPRAK